MLRRLFWTVPVLLTAVVITFALMRLAPGSPWDYGHAAEGPKRQLSRPAIDQLNAKYGLDQPPWRQLLVYLGNVARFDFGDSYRFEGRSAASIVLGRLPITFQMIGIALVLILPIGIGLGLLAALHHNDRLDRAVTGLTTLAASVPNFVVGILLILVFSVGLNRMSGGSFSLPSGGFGLDRHLVMPLMTLSLLPVAFVARLMRSSALETLRQDHVRLATAKGLPRRAVVSRHVVKNSVVPVVTTAGALVVSLLSATVVIESIFRIPGLGGAFVEAVATRDYPVILAATIVYTSLVLVANLAVDIVYVLVDPRVRPG